MEVFEMENVSEDEEHYSNSICPTLVHARRCYPVHRASVSRCTWSSAVEVRAMHAHLDSVDALVLAVFQILCCVLRVDVVPVAVAYNTLSIDSSMLFKAQLPTHLERTAEIARPRLYCCWRATALREERASVKVFMVWWMDANQMSMLEVVVSCSRRELGRRITMAHKTPIEQ
jgi:hypothetical protein